MTRITLFIENKGVRHFSYLFILLSLLLNQPETVSAKTKILMLSPVRIIFTDRQRVANVKISNPTDEAITYAISLITMRKNQEGKLQLVELETEEEKMTREMIRYSPRRATIQPGERQVVKLMVRKPKDLPVGEYQTRLQISPLQTLLPNSQEEESKEKFVIDVLVSSSFPVIIQHGNLSSTVTPQNISIKTFPGTPSGMAAEITLNKTGSGSAFGNVFLYYTTNNKDTLRKIGQALDLAIYLPQNKQTATIPLKDITAQELLSGTIRVTFQPSIGRVVKRAKKSKKSFKDFVLPLP